MATNNVDGRLYRLIAELLEYPRADLTETARECEALLAPALPEAAAALQRFRRFLEDVSLGRLQEVYTITFDLDATCHPYVGHHLFGESYKRSAFLLGLKERYAAHGYSAPATELPDHLAIMTGFLAACDDPFMKAELVADALLPALKPMVKETEAEKPDHKGGRRDEHRPYQHVLRALQLALTADDRPQTTNGGLSGEVPLQRGAQPGDQQPAVGGQQAVVG